MIKIYFFLNKTIKCMLKKQIEEDYGYDGPVAV